MRVRRAGVVLAILSAGFLVLFVRSRPSVKPQISIGNAGYTNFGLIRTLQTGAIVTNTTPAHAVVIVTNTGPVAINYNEWGFNSSALMWAQYPDGWRRSNIGFYQRLPKLLPPGSNGIVHVQIPNGALRWQVGFTVREAGARQRVRSMLNGKWRERFESTLRRMLTDQGADPEPILSPVFEMPGRLRMDCPDQEAAEISNLFNPDIENLTR